MVKSVDINVIIEKIDQKLASENLAIPKELSVPNELESFFEIEHLANYQRHIKTLIEAKKAGFLSFSIKEEANSPIFKGIYFKTEFYKLDKNNLVENKKNFAFSNEKDAEMFFKIAEANFRKTEFSLKQTVMRG